MSNCSVLDSERLKRTGFLPPNQGSAKFKLKTLKVLLACNLNEKVCPSPIGTGWYASPLKIFCIEKLLKDKPRVPINPPPPKPPWSSIWLDPDSTKLYFKSTVPALGSGFSISGTICSASKNPNWPSSLTLLTKLSLLYFCPGFVLNSL